MKTFRKGLLGGFLILGLFQLSAQKEASRWYFGRNAGLNFNTGTPAPLLDGQVNTIEGCESFSDGNGNLLFYTDGKSVWNRNHQLMPNGNELKGSFSTSQAALIIPEPGSSNRYYLFTPDDVLAYNSISLTGSSNGFNYSIIDMAEDGGRGDVVVKNLDLLASASENVTAVKNHDGDFYWIITHLRNRFYAYRLDASGLNTTPVVSTLGPLVDEVENYRGSIKISPDGTRLASAHTYTTPQYQSQLYLYDFDANTGQVSNLVNLSSNRVYYGVEFSSNSSKLYASGIPFQTVDDEILLDRPQIIQFDLDATNILSSEYVVHTFANALPGFVAGALQIGIDKKIYHSIPNERLSVIRTPNLGGINCDFRPFQVDLGGSFATYGLPPYIQSFFETIVTVENFCEGDLTTFTVDGTSNINSIQWNFGDLASGAANTSTDLNPTHVFSSFGVYEVTMEVTYNNGSSREFLEYVEIAEIPNVVAAVELVQCDIDGVEDGISRFNLNEAIPLFNNGNADINALFFENLADAQNNVNHLNAADYQNLVPGQLIYARAFENAECAAIIEVTLTAQGMTRLGDYGLVPICLERPATLAAEIEIQDIYDHLQGEFPGAALGVFRSEEEALLEQRQLRPGKFYLGPFDSPVFYFRTEALEACTAIGQISLEFVSPPDYEKEVEIIRCNGSAMLSAPPGFESYRWQDGETGPEREVNALGTYTVTFNTASCSYEQKFIVIDSDAFELEEIQVRDFSSANSLFIRTSGPSIDLSYSVDGGLSFQNNPRFDGLTPGFYEVMVTDGCKEVLNEILVGGLPQFFTPNNDGINDRWYLPNASFFPGYRIRVFTRLGQLVAQLNASNPDWQGTFNGRELPASDYWYTLDYQGNLRKITGHVAIKR